MFLAQPWNALGVFQSKSSNRKNLDQWIIGIYKAEISDINDVRGVKKTELWESSIDLDSAVHSRKSKKG